MAKFKQKLATDEIKEFENLGLNCSKIFGEMVDAGAEKVLSNARANMSKVFKTTNSLMLGLKKTKIYKTQRDGGINVYVGFYGYAPNTPKTKRHPRGTPIPLIAMAREFGSVSGEAKRPFFRKSFKKKEIQQVMQEVQDKYIKKDD